MHDKRNNIPRLSGWLLAKILPGNDSVNLYGDFEELYAMKADESGSVIARLWLLIQIMKSIPGFVSGTVYWSFAMFKNYIQVGLRNFARNKINSLSI